MSVCIAFVNQTNKAVKFYRIKFTHCSITYISHVHIHTLLHVVLAPLGNASHFYDYYNCLTHKTRGHDICNDGWPSYYRHRSNLRKKYILSDISILSRGAVAHNWLHMQLKWDLAAALQKLYTIENVQSPNIWSTVPVSFKLKASAENGLQVIWEHE